MNQTLEERCRALEERLRLALAENDALAEQAEDILLLGRSAEVLVHEQDPEALVRKFLERVSILKDIPFCAIFEKSEKEFILRSEYAAFAPKTSARLVLPQQLSDALADGTFPPARDLPPGSLSFLNGSFTPAATIALPFALREEVPAALVLADDRRTAEDLQSVAPLLSAMSGMARARLEKLALDQRIAMMNVELEQRVAARTRQLEAAVRALESEAAERKRAQVVIRQAAAAFDHTNEGVVITDASQTIIAVNRAFTAVTGYEPAEVLGKTPRVLQSGKHDKAFYEAMWASLSKFGHWQGEIWNRRKDGLVYPEFLSISAVKDEKGEVTHYLAQFSDLSAAKESEARFEHLAHFDPLTDLPNRLLFRARLEYAAEKARRVAGRLAVMILGIDGFKALNETLGLPAGDELLKSVAQLLRETAREGDTVARLAGDEFIVLLDTVEDASTAAGVAERALEALARPFTIEGRELFVTCSSGISIYPDDSIDLPTLVRNAHAAFHLAKQTGRNSFQFYTAEMRERTDSRFRMESDLRRAEKRGEFLLYFQPQYSLATGEFLGVEALVRWQHPERGLIFPNDFIPVAEQTGVIEGLGAWALREACSQAMAWRAEGFPPFRVAVNLSARQIRAGLVAKVSAALTDSGLEPHLLELEITEGFLVEEPEEAHKTLEALKELGVTLAIDDFGTGYSSLGYLKLLPVDKLKIDRSFVHDIPSSGVDEAIARAIITLGHGFDLKVIAEGVETVDQEQFLREHGCDEVQGFLFSKAVPAADLSELMRGLMENGKLRVKGEGGADQTQS